MQRSEWISDLHWVRQGQQTRSQCTQGERAIGYALMTLGAVIADRLDGERLPTRFGDATDEVFIAETVRSVRGYQCVALPAEVSADR